MSTSTEIYVATETAIVANGDSTATIAKGSTRLPGDHPIVKKYPGFFTLDDSAKTSEPPKRARK